MMDLTLLKILHLTLRKQCLQIPKMHIADQKLLMQLIKKFDKAISNLSSQELAEQSKKYEIDTYLDLY